MDKKSFLFNSLKDKNLLSIYENRLFIKMDGFSPFEVLDIYTKSKDIDKVWILDCGYASFEYWESQDSFIPPWETNWFQLGENFLLKLRGNTLKELVQKGIDKSGNVSLLSKKLDMSSPTFYSFVGCKVTMISVKKLRRLLDYLQIRYDSLNDFIEYTKKGYKISINHTKFPFNLNNGHAASILGNVVSDGCVYIDKKARSVIRTKYSTNEDESIIQFTEKLNQIFGEVAIQK